MADLYGSITDKAVNHLIRLMMTYRPSLFNYGAPSWKVTLDATGKPVGVQDLWLSCQPVNLPPGANPATTPRFTREDYLPAPGVGLKLELPWCLQVTDAEVDFHPVNVVTPPPEIPALAAQSFIIRVRATFGLGCPSAEMINGLLAYAAFANTLAMWVPRYPVNIVPVTSLYCFALEGFGVCKLERQFVDNPPKETVGVALGQLEIVDLAPPGLEDVVECYLATLVRVMVQPKLALALHRAVTKALGFADNLKLNPQFTPGVPNNPAIEQNELRVWVDVNF